MKILLAEDNLATGEFIKEKLEDDKNTVDWAQDGVAAEHSALSLYYDAIIMDLNLPRRSGLDVIKNLRKSKCNVPILILTANNKPEDCIEGLSSGADDYLAKPFVYEVMRERLNALARRASKNYDETLKHRDLILNPKKHSLTFKGNPFYLATHEYKLLETLMRHPNQVMKREQLMQILYGWDAEIASNVLEVNVHKIRKYFGTDYIRTIRSVGYQIG